MCHHDVPIVLCSLEFGRIRLCTCTSQDFPCISAAIMIYVSLMESYDGPCLGWLVGYKKDIPTMVELQENAPDGFQ